MECREARALLSDRRRGPLAEGDRAAIDRHLASCEDCRHEDAVEQALTAVLKDRLKSRRAPERLRRAVEGNWDAPPRRRIATGGVARTLGAMAVGAALAGAAMFASQARTSGDALVAEAINDHLRVLASEHPLGIESGGIHQVKPWFEGRLDFAPIVPFEGDEDFVLQGGAIAYFLDRKAATFVYKRRLHVVTLFVFQAEGLAWPPNAARPRLDAGRAVRTSRGFHVLGWKAGDLGYALVSDVDARDLGMLAGRIAGGV